jgi:hypothetical protein
MRAEVIRGHQSSSEAIRGHQSSSEPIRGNQSSSELIRAHQRQSELIRAHQSSSEPIRAHLTCAPTSEAPAACPGTVATDDACHPRGTAEPLQCAGSSSCCIASAASSAAADGGRVGAEPTAPRAPTHLMCSVVEMHLRAQSVAISGNQWRSVAISGDQWPSVAISGHRWPSPAKRADEERAAQDKSQQGEPKRAVAQPSEQPFYKLGSARHGARAAARAGLVVSHWSLLVRRRSYEAEGAVRGNQRPSEALGQSEAIRGNHL